MRIGLLDIDFKSNTKNVYPNLALCKIAAWHKAQVDIVEFATPFDHYDILYRSKIFNFSPDDTTIYNADKEIRGGTGYDIASTLPAYIDDMQPDFTIYPNIAPNTSWGFLTRGCPNKCAWCVVPRKEGAIRPYWDIDRVANGAKNVILMDNNILAAGDYAIEQFHKIIDRGYRVDFNQALDARLITPEHAKLLARMKWIERRIRFGCDTPKQIDECERAIHMITEEGFKGQFFLYCMLTDDFYESWQRLMYWWLRDQELRDMHKTARIYPHCQPFRDPINPNRTIPQWQKDMAHWCNRKVYFESTPFEEFRPRKNFSCGEYVKQYTRR